MVLVFAFLVVLQYKFVKYADCPENGMIVNHLVQDANGQKLQSCKKDNNANSYVNSYVNSFVNSCKKDHVILVQAELNFCQC